MSGDVPESASVVEVSEESVDEAQDRSDVDVEELNEDDDDSFLDKIKDVFS